MAHQKDFCKVFFPDRFSRPFSKQHEEVFKLIDNNSLQKVAIAAHRGFGKTSIVNMAKPAKSILFDDYRYIVNVSASSGAAVEQSENLKHELLYNGIIGKLKGNLKSDNFSKEEWITSNNIKVLPRGAGQQVRGRLHMNSRPDLILVDDLEDSEAVKNEDRRKALKQWFFSDLVNSVDRGNKKWRIIVIGTVLHEDSLLNNLLEDSDWASVRLELCDENYNSKWSEFMTDEEIQKLANSYKDKGLLSLFYQEYRNICVANEEGFQQQWFRYFNCPDKESSEKYSSTTIQQLIEDPYVRFVIIADPAKTFSTGSAFTGVIAIGVNIITNSIYVCEVVNEMLSPDETINCMCDLGTKYGAFIYAPEVTSLNMYITMPLEQELRRRRLSYIICEVKPRASKEERAGSLIPLYRMGSIYHNYIGCGALEEQELSFPRPRKWDVLDCLGHIHEVMEKEYMYFTPGPEYIDISEKIEVNWRRI